MDTLAPDLDDLDVAYLDASPHARSVIYRLDTGAYPLVGHATLYGGITDDQVAAYIAHKYVRAPLPSTVELTLSAA